MILMSQSINQCMQTAPILEPKLWQWLKACWRFSQFYGDYQSLPPSQRRRWMEFLPLQRQR